MFYSQSGYEILAKNFRTTGSEIDLIVLKGGVITIVEVKTRRHFNLSLAQVESMMGSKKIEALKRGFNRWMHQRQFIAGSVQLELMIVDYKSHQIIKWPDL